MIRERNALYLIEKQEIAVALQIVLYNIIVIMDKNQKGRQIRFKSTLKMAGKIYWRPQDYSFSGLKYGVAYFKSLTGSRNTILLQLFSQRGTRDI